MSWPKFRSDHPSEKANLHPSYDARLIQCVLAKIYLRATSVLGVPLWTVTSRKPQLLADSVMKASW